MVMENMFRKDLLLMKDKHKEYCHKCGHEILVKVGAFKKQSCLVTLCKCPECHGKLE